MIRYGRQLFCGAGFLCAGFAASPALPGETRQFEFDALGRLVAIEIGGGPRDGTARDYTFDSAGNRANVTGSGGAGGVSACTLRTHDVHVADAFEALVKIEPVEVCAVNVPLTATVTQVSGTGSWSLAAFNGSSTLNDGQAYKIFRIVPVAGSVPANDPLVLRVSFSTTASHATFLIAHSAVTITGSQ